MEKNMLKMTRKKRFANGIVYALKTEDGYPIEVTDTFLPFYTKDAIGMKQNKLKNYDIADRDERWMIGVSCMSGCPVRCKFCATAKLKKCRNLTADEIVDQVMFIVNRNKKYDPNNSKEFKINYTRMGEPFLNIKAVREAIQKINEIYPGTHHYISTIGIKGSDYTWIKDNITLQVSLHSLDEDHRNWLIPYKKKFTIEELGQIRTESNLNVTVNLTLVNESDFDIAELKRNFDPKQFFIKLSPINTNEISDKNALGKGIIKANNLI